MLLQRFDAEGADESEKKSKCCWPQYLSVLISLRLVLPLYITVRNRLQIIIYMVSAPHCISRVSVSGLGLS